MNTLRTIIQWISGPMLVLCLLAQPALAQKKNAVVTIEQSDGADTVVIKIEDGERSVTVNGEELSEEEAEKYLGEMDMVWLDGGDMRIFNVGPHGRRFHFSDDGSNEFLADIRDQMREVRPHSFLYDHDGEGDQVFFLDDQLRSLGDELRVFGRDAGNFAFGMPMKEQAEIARLEMESRRLARKIRDASEADRADLERQLRDQLEETFDLKERLRTERVNALQEQLDKATSARQERQQNRQEIIERRLKELLGERDKYDW